MGSVSTHRERGMTTRQFFEKEISLAEKTTILASAVVGGTFYAAVKSADDAKYHPGQVTALVIATTWSSGYYNYTYKDMDEFYGPNEAACPDKILDLLSPLGECHHELDYCQTCNAEINDETGVWMRFATEHEDDRVAGPRCAYFLESERQADGSAPVHTPGGHGYCSTQHARDWRARCREYNARVRQAKAVKPGTVIRTPRTIEFRSGLSGDTFTYVGKTVFLLDGYRVSLGRGWQATAFEIVQAA